MIEHFNQWFFGSGDYQAMGVIIEIFIFVVIGFSVMAKVMTKVMK